MRREENFEIFLEDLVPAKRKELMELLGISTAREGNYDIYPIANLIINPSKQIF